MQREKTMRKQNVATRLYEVLCQGKNKFYQICSSFESFPHFGDFETIYNIQCVTDLD